MGKAMILPQAGTPAQEHPKPKRNFLPLPCSPGGHTTVRRAGIQNDEGRCLMASAFVCYNGMLYYSRYCELMDLFSYTRRMVSAKRSAMLMMCTLSHCLV